MPTKIDWLGSGEPQRSRLKSGGFAARPADLCVKVP